LLDLGRRGLGLRVAAAPQGPVPALGLQPSPVPHAPNSPASNSALGPRPGCLERAAACRELRVPRGAPGPVVQGHLGRQAVQTHWLLSRWRRGPTTAQTEAAAAELRPRPSGRQAIYKGRLLRSAPNGESPWRPATSSVRLLAAPASCPAHAPAPRPPPALDPRQQHGGGRVLPVGPGVSWRLWMGCGGQSPAVRRKALTSLGESHPLCPHPHPKQCLGEKASPLQSVINR
jgi:hypothetical protein